MVISVILYGAPIWADALSSNRSYGTTFQRACRTAAVRDIALLLIAGMRPNDLIEAERAKMYREVKRTEKDDVNQEQSHKRWSRRTSVSARRPACQHVGNQQTRIGGPIVSSRKWGAGRPGNTDLSLST